jgi:large subunit ribosomal protein L4
MGEAGKAVAEKIKIDVFSMDRKKVSEAELEGRVFAAEIKPHLMHQVVVWQEAKHRRGTAKVKTRGEVSGTGKKPWRQKGTGRSRHGSLRSPLWPGGGKVFGPIPRSYEYTIQKKMKKAALRGALSLKLKENRLFVLDKIQMDEIKTKKFQDFCKRFELDGAMVVVAAKDEKVEKSARNLQDVKILRAEGINVRDLLQFNWLVMELDAVKKVSEAL